MPAYTNRKAQARCLYARKRPGIISIGHYYFSPCKPGIRPPRLGLQPSSPGSGPALQKTPAVMINRQVFFYFISLITDQFCLR